MSEQQQITPSTSSLELFAAAVTAADVGMVVTDQSLPDGPVVFVNEAFCRITGYAREEVLGRNCRFLQGVGTEQAARDEIRAAIAAGRPVEVELLNYRRDGRPFWNALRLVPAGDGGAEPRYLVGAMHDVTERRRAEEALKDEEVVQRAVAEIATDGILITDVNGKILRANPAAGAMFGQAGGDLAGRDARLLIPGVYAREHEIQLARWLAADGRRVIGPRCEAEARRVDGSTFPVELAVAVLARRGVRMFVTFTRDLTLAKRAEEALRESEQRYRLLSDSTREGVLIYDLERISEVNNACCALFGYERSELEGLDPLLLLTPATREMVRSRRLAGVYLDPFEGACLRKDGSTFPAELCARLIEYRGQMRRVGIIRDITDRRRAEAALRESEQRFRGIGDSVPVIIWTVDPAGTCTYVNRRWYEYTGQNQGEGEGEGKGWLDCIHPDDLATTYAGMEAAIARREPFQVEYRLRRHDGSWRWMLDAGAPRFDGGEFLGYVGSVVDIDERRRAEARIRHLAHHDPLTGLPNRALFQDRLQQALAQAHRYGEQVGLLLLDLDRFKDANDSLGHDAGDAVLRAVAVRLQTCVRESDTVARLGGDEFAVVLPRLPAPAAAAEVAAKIAAALSEPVSYGATLIHTGASVGITLFPGDGDEASQLLKNADIALYRAKAEGGRGYCFFVADMRRQVERRKGIEDELRLALARGEIVPFFQPKVHLRDGRVVGLEALARWRHPERGLVLPSEFLPVAEETGLITALGETVLRQAVAHARAWQRARLPLGSMAVNVAGAQLRRGELSATIKAVLAESGLAPRWLVVEVTEGAFLGRGADRVATELGALHAMGVHVALDDFGTGYASLTHLKRFPVGILKIDQSFVRDMLVDPGDAAIVRAVINLGHSLGMRVVAEGVETGEQADWLRLQGCDYGQGHHFGKAMPAEAVAGWLKRRAPARV